MNFEDFQLLDNEPLDKSIIKKDFAKKYHRQGDQINYSDQNIEFIFGENSNYHQIGNAFLNFNFTVWKKDTTHFHNDDPICLINNDFAFCFRKARLTTSIGGDIENIKFCGQISTILRPISNKDGDFLSQFGNINENDIPVLQRLANLPFQIQSTPHQRLLINNHTDENKDKMKGYLCLEDVFGFCENFKKVT